MAKNITPRRHPADGGINIGGIAYEDEQQTRFAFTCSLHGFGLPSFDDFIDSLPDGIARQELLDWRQQTFRAFETGNKLALRGWLQACWTNWRARLTIDHARPTLAMGLNYQKAQQEKGKAGAEARWGIGADSELRMNDIIERLALSQEHNDETAQELWPHLYANLDALHLNPDEQENPADWLKSRITYCASGKQREITGKTFANQISKHRSKKKSQ